jgi:hypothetical protein
MKTPRRVRRGDLVPRPDSESTADFNDGLDIVGVHGSGLVFLHSPTLRLVSGYECRWRDGAFEPHPAGRYLVSGKKPMPYCHHGLLPHLLVPRERNRVDLLFFLGAWGHRSRWGDGTEAAYPQYRHIIEDSRRRRDWRWCDGQALEVTAIGSSGEEAPFSSLDWKFWHGPGFVWFTPVEPHALLEHVVLLVPTTPNTALVHVTLRDPEARVRLDFRPMLAALRLPEEDAGRVVDFLDPSHGWGCFRWHSLTPSPDPRGGLRFTAEDAGLRLVLLAEGHRVETALAATRPEAERSAALEPCPDDPPPATCYDAAVTARSGADRVITFRLGAERLRPRPEEVRVPPFPHAFLVPRDGRNPLRFWSGNRHVDGYVRWSRVTARSLVWPNGVLATGALGYGAMSHVGQDIPFLYPFLLMEDHHLFRRAARRNVELVWDRAGEGVGITDHPSDGFDFAFLPFDPDRGRVWKRTGAAGLCRQIQMLGRYWAWTGDEARTARWFERAASLYREHYLPFRADHPRWTTGLETQARLFALIEAPAALRTLAKLATRFGSDEDRARFVTEAEAVLDHLDRPDREGGYRLTGPMRSADGQTLPPGVLAEPERTGLTGDAFSFDVLLVTALALARDALRPERRADAVRHLADRNSPWWVDGIGLAKAHGGRLGVWFWHNAVAASALLSCRDLDPDHVDTAWQLMTWMGKGTVDLNGRGCPGEEIQGGDHAMAIGCLGAPVLIDGLLRPEPKDTGLRLDPTLPSGVEELVVENLHCRDRLHRVCVRRRSGDRTALVTEIRETGERT